MIILSISPVVIDSQTPSIPSRFGNISTGSKYQYASTLAHVSAIFTPPSAAREFDTLKSKKVPQSLEIGLFFCQIFIFII